MDRVGTFRGLNHHWGHVWRLLRIVMEQPLWTVTKHCNLEKPSGCLKLLTRSYCLLLALEKNRAVLCSHFCFSLLVCKQALEKITASARFAETQVLWNLALQYQAFQCFSHVQKPQPWVRCTGTLCNAWGEQSTSTRVHRCLQHREKGARAFPAF